MNAKTDAMGGFTLLELVVVVGILALIANLATEYVVQVTDQNRYETSQDRLDALRYAIVGDTRRTSNGQPDLVGFVHDMGRPPRDLAELYREPADCNPQQAGDQTCTATYANALGRTVGWRGPYVAERTAAKDGWANGWVYEPRTGADTETKAAPGTVAIRSLGADGSPGGAGYGTDLETRIRPADYRVMDPVRVTVSRPLTGVCLTAQLVRHGGVETVVSSTTLPSAEPGEYRFPFPEGLPMGRMALTLHTGADAACRDGEVAARWTTTIYPRRTLAGFQM